MTAMGDDQENEDAGLAVRDCARDFTVNRESLRGAPPPVLERRMLVSPAYVALDEVFDRCSRRGWDGHRAQAISRATYDRARLFLESLPSTVPAPDIVPETDGDIAIEWERGPQHMFSVSIGAMGRVNFVGVYGEEERHGIEPFDGVISPDLLFYIRKLFSASGGN